MTTREDQPGCDGDRLWALAVGVLSEEDSRREGDHLTTCVDCQDRLATIRADVDALGYPSTGDASPQALAEQVLARSRGIQARAKRLRWLALGGVLVGFVVLGLTSAHRLAERNLARRGLWSLEHAIQRIQNAEGSYPADEQELRRALARHPDAELRLDEQGRPLDHWGQPFRYRYPGAQVPEQFDLWSLGPNAVDDEGGPDDLTNWR